jgi:hypothetical protein
MYGTSFTKVNSPETGAMSWFEVVVSALCADFEHRLDATANQDTAKTGRTAETALDRVGTRKREDPSIRQSQTFFRQQSLRHHQRTD